MPQPSALDVTLAYHERTKHLPGRYARSLGYMDWDTQPDPFRRFAGAPLVPLDREPPVAGPPSYEAAFAAGAWSPRPLDRRAVSQLLFDSLALSAWKRAGSSRWPLRVNPSSGNLHPTEAYLVTGPIAGISAEAAVFHYAPREHALEQRAVIGGDRWSALAAGLPERSLLIGLTSIHWREAWKYGERAFRYCQHDLGHAIGALSVAAAGLGWEARLLEAVGDEELAALLGIARQGGIEAEWPECLVALAPRGLGPPDARLGRFAISPAVTAALRELVWQGEPNRLSAGHHEWPEIDEVASATRRPSGLAASGLPHEARTPPIVDASPAGGPAPGAPPWLRPIIHGRRSAVGLDGRTGITAGALSQILRQTLPSPGSVPFGALPWQPCIDLILFIHRVEGVEPGLYCLLRAPGRLETLRAALDPAFAWQPAVAVPPSLPLYLLSAGDARRAAVQTSCGQEFAGDGVMAVAMLAEYREPMERCGPWMYRRLFWEAGVVGQQLYLEAEASGIRGSGIGCYFDDLTHGILGLRGDRFQVLYHFTMGGPVEDPRILVEPPYPALIA